MATNETAVSFSMLLVPLHILAPPSVMSGGS
jgi:hypothetical protein